MEAYGLLLVTVGIIIFFSFYGPTSQTFPTMANFQIVLAGQSVLAVVALGTLIPLTADVWDLSIGAIAGLAAVFGAAFMSSGMSAPLAILAAIGVAGIVGVVNALISTKGGVHPVITTMGTSTIVAGVVTQKTGGLAIVSNLPAWLVELGHHTTFGIPALAVIATVVALFAYYLLNHTPFGRYLYAIGSNPNAAPLVGIRTGKLISIAFILGACFAGVAGIMQVAYAGGASTNIGTNLALTGMAASFLSAAAIKPGKYNVPGAVVALIFLAALNSGLNLAGVPPFVNEYVNGAALIVGIGFASNIGRLRERSGS
ncbi:ABC transporter permease [Nocardioides sp. CER19]|uniref:ABC transporter permease n=1 Tax=Nocardioides sp. CER19 TaxID=3038538 RepID=UPI00244CF646|nr:ABC transporter permease [Nocardioides sp. CER19]MDH2416148.1 ABC transporter permease [Nocardioides sp. CER19]